MITQVVFDLDLTLIGLNNELLPDTKNVLDYLQNKNINLYIASHNLSAKKIIKSHELDSYFVDYSLGYPNNCINKTENLKALNLDKNNTIFFDDDQRIIKICRLYGWNVYRVNTSGITMNDIKSII